MKLHYKITGCGQPIILLHGLFGNLDNLAVLARAFSDHYQIIQVDLRNHGLSPWSDEMNYQLMANDILALIDELSLTDVILIGHSMGGKVAMQLTQYASAIISQIVILDIAPVCYASDSHANVFKAINACLSKQAIDKKEISQIMSEYIPVATIQFLLKSYKSENWLFNFKAIAHHYSDIRGWHEITPYLQPILFIRGGESSYIVDEYQTDILGQFPYATIATVDGAGHNVHTENPQQVIALINEWLN